jgi:hypothetical protein
MVVQLVEALRYKSEGRRIDSLWRAKIIDTFDILLTVYHYVSQ